MSFEHKAFVFCYARFCKELESVLTNALASGDLSGLVSFIEENRAVLKDPYEGDPLGSGWRGLIEEEDAHQFGDFALTKYYDPVNDIGLGLGWEQVQSDLEEKFGSGSEMVLGHTVGPGENFFDPGKMGSYFQSEWTVNETLRKLRNLPPHELTEAIRRFSKIIEQSSGVGKGLYITF